MQATVYPPRERGEYFHRRAFGEKNVDIATQVKFLIVHKSFIVPLFL